MPVLMLFYKSPNNFSTFWRIIFSNSVNLNRCHQSAVLNDSDVAVLLTQKLTWRALELADTDLSLSTVTNVG